MRFAWVGFHAEGLPALEALLEAGAPIHAVLTLRRDLAAKRSGGGDPAPVASRFGVPVHRIAGINEPDALALLEGLTPDVVFVIGWHQIVRAQALRLARVGMIGAHASLLPHNRGSAPINWAIIRGEHQTGNSLIWLSETLDAGDLIDQRAFPITPYDTCASLYAHVAATNKAMLLGLLPRLMAGERPARHQPTLDEPNLPHRRPADGKVDWSCPSSAVYNSVRALTRPYPGAFSYLDGRRWSIWQAALPPATIWPGGQASVSPGAILGPVVSPVEAACGQLVACGQGGSPVILLELEDESGTVLKGRALADQPWTGRSWTNG